MKFGQYFYIDDSIKVDLSPENCRINYSKIKRVLINFSLLLRHLILFALSILVFMTIAIELPKNKLREIIFITGIFILFGLYIWYIFYYYGVVGERWRKDNFEKWFRVWRINDLFEYLDGKKLLELKIYNKDKNIFENEMFGKKIKIDYLVKPTKGSTVLVGTPIATFNSKNYEEYSHMFNFEFLDNRYANLVLDIAFCGNKRLKFGTNEEKYFYKVDITKSVFSLQKKDSKNNEIIKKIESIILKYPNLKGEIFIKKGKLQIIFYDKFKIINKKGRYSHQSFLKNEDNKNLVFKGFEEIIEIL